MAKELSSTDPNTDPSSRKLAQFSSPANDRWFEDYVAGDVHEFGDIMIDEARIIEFAREFDPQPMHVDAGAAKESIHEGIIASGWHTGSLMMRQFCDHYLSSVASLGSPGMDELRWLRPVRGGDRLWVRVTVISARPSKSKPDRGIVESLIEVINQGGAVVMRMRAMNLFFRKGAKFRRSGG